MNARYVPAPAQSLSRCAVSVIIRSCNDEQDICDAIESALAAVRDFGGEVIVADMHSTDRTLRFASSYPVRVVQPVDPREHSRAVGAQLGYQHSRGDFLFLLDAHEQPAPGFLVDGLSFLARHPEAAGVGGGSVHGASAGAALFSESAMPHKVGWLEGAALYRRTAIRETGYLSDRNLRSYEHIERATRLRSLGWKLWRIGPQATLPRNCAYATALPHVWDGAATHGTERRMHALRVHLAILLNALRGMLRLQRPPTEPIASRVVREPPQTSSPRREHYA
jgi:hypothetical protein